MDSAILSLGPASLGIEDLLLNHLTTPTCEISGLETNYGVSFGIHSA